MCPEIESRSFEVKGIFKKVPEPKPFLFFFFISTHKTKRFNLHNILGYTKLHFFFYVNLSKPLNTAQ